MPLYVIERVADDLMVGFWCTALNVIHGGIQGVRTEAASLRCSLFLIEI